MSVFPNVSIVTPTKDRAGFLAQCRTYIEAQTYPRHLLEWVIVDSSDRPSVPRLEVVRGLRTKIVDCMGAIGHLRNVGNRHAAGDIVVHFDDDDWHSPRRVDVQVTALRKPGVDLVCTDDYLTYFGPGRVARSWSWGMDLFSSGGTFAYWRKAWTKVPFTVMQHGEDQVFARTIRLTGRARNLRDPSLFAYIRHAANTCVFNDELERRCSADEYQQFRAILKGDLDFYEPPEASDHGYVERGSETTKALAGP